ncbi:hypothetical protein ACH4GP_36805 [Streptomyces celluloflavus]|uniref:Uncharacterized protein n=1 Tax=Streptomyces celluloflavus TaxID=58344 RepID=A0ABW7RR51_9ACTN
MAGMAGMAGMVGGDLVEEPGADRIARRLAEQMRPAGPVKDMVGGLIGVGLPERRAVR